MDIRTFFAAKTKASESDKNESGTVSVTASADEKSVESPSKKIRYSESVHITQPSTTGGTFNDDFGLFVGMQINDSQKFKLLTNPWKPGIGFKFPPSGPRNLKFNLQWLGDWNWLTYSPSQDGAYCKFCALFSTTVGQQGSQGGKLVKQAYRQWKNAKEDFRHHESTKYHSSCLEKAGLFTATFSGSITSIDKALDDGRRVQEEKNREALKPIIQTAMFLARRGLAFRGHRDTDTFQLNEGLRKEEGNFRSLQKFRVESGDNVLKSHLENSAKNAKFISWKSQNDIIQAFNNIILRKLVDRVNKAKYFTVLGDETTDISNVCQLSLCVRFVEDNNVCEEFLQFIPVTDVTGKGLADVICQALINFGLNTKYLVGQGYDGARAMSGHVRGTQAFVRELYPKALYVHCCSHVLNLSISEGCSIPAIRNCMGVIESVYNFFNSPKRANVLKIETDKIEKSGPMAEKLKRMCPTRWVQRHDSVKTFKDLLHPIFAALEVIKTWTDKKAATDASVVQASIEKPEFLVSLCVTNHVFSITRPLSVYLQKENLDLAAAMNAALVTKKALGEIQEDADNAFSKLFTEVSALGESLDVSITKPRRVGRQTENSKLETPEEFYKNEIFLPFLKSTLQALEEKFVKHADILAPFQKLLDAASDTSKIAQSAQHLAEFYDLESTGILGEAILWFSMLTEKKPQNSAEALTLCNVDLLPTMHGLLTIMATLPVTTCCAERSFSSLKNLKTYLRNSTGEERLNGIALMYIHENVAVSEEEVLDELSKKPRRMKI